MSWSDLAEHLPVLQVVIPLLAAPLCVPIRNGRATWAFATLISAVSFVISVLLLQQVLISGSISYPIGNWAAPWGIEYVVTPLSAIIVLIVSALSTVVLFGSARSIAFEIPKERQYLFFTMWLLCLTGLLGMAVTGDAFNLFVFLEISSLATYVLVAMAADRRALTAAYRYLIIGTVGATFYVLSVGLLYMMTGTLNMADLAQRLPEVGETRTILVALGFLVVGLSIKLALFPLHVWLPNAYAYAPNAVTAFLAGTATKVAVYVLVRLIFTVIGVAAFQALHIDFAIMIMALLAMFAASAVAIFQEDIKRMLAYSSVAQIGYIMLGVSIATTAGLNAATIHVFNHAIMKTALFLVLGGVFLRAASVKIGDMAGLGKEMPWTMAAFVIGGLSLIGVPGTVGFISKWQLIIASINNGQWYLAFAVVASSLLAIAYVWRVVEVVYFQPRRKNARAIKEAPISLLVPLWFLIAAIVYFGVDAESTVSIADEAARYLLGTQLPPGGGPS